MNIGSFAKGMIAGALIGTTAAMMMQPIKAREKKMITRGASRIFTKLGHFADNLTDMMR